MHTTPMDGRPTLVRFRRAERPGPPASPLAIASSALAVVTSLFWIYEFFLEQTRYINEIGILLALIFSPLAIVLGFGALWQIRRGRGTVGGVGFAVTGIIIGLLVVPIELVPAIAFLFGWRH